MTFAAIIISLSAMTNTDQTIQSTRQESSYHVEGQAGLLGVGWSVGLSKNADVSYLLKASADTYIQGASASIGLHHRKFFTGPHYFETGIGGFAMGTDETLSDERGPYVSLAFGRSFTNIGKLFYFGIEWTSLSILYSTDDKDFFFKPTAPKLSLGARF